MTIFITVCYNIYPKIYQCFITELVRSWSFVNQIKHFNFTCGKCPEPPVLQIDLSLFSPDPELNENSEIFFNFRTWPVLAVFLASYV